MLSMPGAGMDVIWGEKVRKFHKELVSSKDYTPAIAHLDLDCLDERYGKVNNYPSPHGFFENGLYECMATVGENGKPISLRMVCMNVWQQLVKMVNQFL
jgi:arginase